MSLLGLVGRGFGAVTPPATPTLSIVDSENGSQAVATIASGDSDATHAVSVQSVASVGGNWTAAGSRTGNGTVTLTLATGYYWGRVVAAKNGATSVSNLVYFAITNGDDAFSSLFIDGLVAKLQGLALTGVTGSNIVKRKHPYDRNLSSPAIVVSPFPENLNAAAGSNIRDDIDYRYAITIFRASNEDLTSDMNWMARTRERIRTSLHNQRLTVTGATGWRTVIEPGSVYIPQSFAQANIDSGYLVARVTNRESRNL